MLNRYDFYYLSTYLFFFNIKWECAHRTSSPFPWTHPCLHAFFVCMVIAILVTRPHNSISIFVF